MTDTPDKRGELSEVMYKMPYSKLAPLARDVVDRTADWHNKQVEAVLDRLEKQSVYIDCPHSQDILCECKGETQYIRVIEVLYIEAERNKLKESSND